MIFAFECYVSISFHWFARYSSRCPGRRPSRSRGLFASRAECTWICTTRQKHELAIFSTVGVLNEMSHQATNLIRVLRRAALAINLVFSKQERKSRSKNICECVLLSRLFCPWRGCVWEVHFISAFLASKSCFLPLNLPWNSSYGQLTWHFPRRPSGSDSAPYFGRWTCPREEESRGLRSVRDLRYVITAASRHPSSS